MLKWMLYGTGAFIIGYIILSIVFNCVKKKNKGSIFAAGSFTGVILMSIIEALFIGGILS